MCALKNVEPVIIISTSPSIASPTLVSADCCVGVLILQKLLSNFLASGPVKKLCGFGGWDVVDNVVAHIFEDIFKKVFIVLFHELDLYFILVCRDIKIL